MFPKISIRYICTQTYSSFCLIIPSKAIKHGIYRVRHLRYCITSCSCWLYPYLLIRVQLHDSHKVRISIAFGFCHANLLMRYQSIEELKKIINFLLKDNKTDLVVIICSVCGCIAENSV